jgi:mono/diheme cytochrome c family protein
MKRSIAITSLLLAAAAVVGCRKQDMADQPKQDTYDQSKFFADGQSARPLIPGTVARGHAPVKEALFAVTLGNEPQATSFPKDFPTDTATLRARLDRGREQFNIYCSVCHGQLGDGKGMIVQRGFPQPPSYYTSRLRNAPVGHYFNVISNGYGAMYSYGDRIKVDDRWNIVAYIKALQASAKDSNGNLRMDPDISRAATQPAQVK